MSPVTVVKPKRKKIFLYLIYHTKQEIRTITYVGASGHFNKRLAQHNGELNGGPRLTKRASGFWKPVLVLELDKNRKISTKKLKKIWKASSRGLDSRIKKGLLIARKYKLRCYISMDSKFARFRWLQPLWDDEHKIVLNQSEWDKLVED